MSLENTKIQKYESSRQTDMKIMKQPHKLIEETSDKISSNENVSSRRNECLKIIPFQN